MRSGIVGAIALLAGVLVGPPASGEASRATAPYLIVSTQDGKYQRVNGQGLVRTPHVPDSLIVFDASDGTPKIVTRVSDGIEQSIAGPPQSVAITPDGRLALLGAPSRLGPRGETINDDFIQIVDLAAHPARVAARLPAGTTIQGIAISPDGRRALACGVDGQVRVLSIDKGKVRIAQTIRLSRRRLASAIFLPDGRHALVTRRDDGGAAVLAVDSNGVHDTGRVLASGLSPYALGVSDDGHWAVTGNVGLPGQPGFTLSQSTGDADTITLYDLSATPYRAVDYATTPAIPEGISISPDGRWIAVQAMGGSFLPRDQAGHTDLGTLLLFRNDGGHLVRTGAWTSGVAGQAVAFVHGSALLLVQRNVEHEIALYRRVGGTLVRTGTTYPTGGGPVAFNATPPGADRVSDTPSH